MDILILDSWLREHLETNAVPFDIARCLSLCGPSIEKVESTATEGKKDFIYHIEVTTNRVDMMSVTGIAREAAVILPEFGFKTKLIDLKIDDKNETFKPSFELSIKSDKKLEDRIMGVILEISSIGESPNFIKDRLEATGIRSLNSVVDITNYVMTEVGHPTHVFDYNLVKPVMRIRESTKGETVQSFDGKDYTLPGGDIVIDDGRERIIDLPGIIGTKNSVVNENTKRILFFTDTNEPVKIRKTSMTLGIRTVAATLNEKGVDPNLAEVALRRGLYLYKNTLKAKQLSGIYDLFTGMYKPKTIKVKHDFIEKLLGINIKKIRVQTILKNLGMEVSLNKNDEYEIKPPSFRARDITIPEDIVEEVARIYGYHNLPSTLMAGNLPQSLAHSPFKFETKLKLILKESAGVEIYNLAMDSISNVSAKAVRIKNPLGGDGEYLRTSLMPQLTRAVLDNPGEKEPFHLFEMANVYNPRNSDLPEEKIMLAGIFSGFNYRMAKGIIEHLLESLNIHFSFKVYEERGFLPNQCLIVTSENEVLGKFGILEAENLIYYEFETKLLEKFYKEYSSFKVESKYPPQVEDITLVFPDRLAMSQVLDVIKKESSVVTNIELKGIYNNFYTFTVTYQSPDKTLENSEIKEVRDGFLKKLSTKFGITQK